MTKADRNYQELQQKIEKYTDMLFKLSYIRLQNQQDAEDVVQEVFYQYLRNTTSFESREHEKAWLLRVIHLFYYEELSVKEIARITGRGESTVTSQLTRGRELLRKSLKEEYDFG